MNERIVIDVDRDGWTKGLQLNIAQLDETNTGTGYRLAGPKYNGSSKNLLRCELDARDANEVRKCLDAVFPQKDQPAPVLTDAERQFLTFALELAADQMLSRGDEFDAADEDALTALRRMADGAAPENGGAS